MANTRWQPGALTTPQVGQITYATYDVTTTYGVTIGGKSYSTVGTGGSITTTVAALLALVQASTEPEFTEVTWTASVGVLTYTVPAGGAGKPVTVTGTVAGGTGTQTPAAVTANSGLNVWDAASNWSLAAAPVATNAVFIDNSNVSILYDLSQAGATLASGTIAQSFTGTIGLPKTNRDGAPYNEYRTDYLTVDCTSWIIGRGPGLGSGRIKINSGTVQTAVVVENTGTSAEIPLESFLWKGTHASNAMTVRGGSVGIGVFGGEAATLLTLAVEGNARVRIGAGVTLGTLTVNGGTVEVNCAIGTSLVVNGGTVTINGTGAIAALAQGGGTIVYNTTGTLGGNPTVGGAGRLDFSQDPRTGKTVTNPITIYGTAARVDDRNKVVTGGSGLVVVCSQGATSAQVNWGPNATLTRT